MKAKLLLLKCFIISQLVLGIVECEPTINEKIDQWLIKVNNPTENYRIIGLYREYYELLKAVAEINEDAYKLTCEVKLEFSSYWFLIKEVEDGKQKIADSLIILKRNALNDKLKKEFGIKHKKPYNGTAFTDYYTAKKGEISKLLEERNPDCFQGVISIFKPDSSKQAAKFGFELVSTAYVQFDTNKSLIKLADLRSALEDINKMKKTFSQSNDLFDALSFYLCLIYSNLIMYHADIPKDFKDPITNILMEDPVKLPDNYIVDRATIRERGYVNPFNQNHVIAENLVPQENLCKRITEWKLNTFKSYKIKNENSLECVLLD